jgi:hypothetical protein
MITSIEEEIKELEREQEMRKSVYPGMIKTNKLTRAEANHRYLCLANTIKRLQLLNEQNKGNQTTLFNGA